MILRAIAYGCLLISTAWLGYLYSIDVHPIIYWIAWFFNPLTIFGIIRMWMIRETLKDNYELFQGFWRLRRYEKEHGVIEIDETED